MEVSKITVPYGNSTITLDIKDATARSASGVSAVKVGTTLYSPTDGIISLPAYPSVPVTSVASKTGDVTLTASDVGAASSTHTHGNINNGGTITSTAVTTATGFLVYDSSSNIQRITKANAKTVLGVPTKMSDICTMYYSNMTADTSVVASLSGSSNHGMVYVCVYINNTDSAKVLTVPTTYATPDGAPIELTIPAGGYGEVNLMNVNGIVYARAS